MGDVISKHGAAIPVLGLDDNVYECIIRLDTEKSEVDDLIVIENGSFPLHVSSKLIIADMAVLVEWEKDLGWETVLLPLGYYAVTIRGFREIKNGEIIRFGFEFVLSPCDILPELTANLSMSMQILKL